jgi:hypothetical protein
LVAEGKAVGPKRRTFVFVNHRLEGNAIATIEAMMARAAEQANRFPRLNGKFC